jgi:beta-lactamase class D
MRFVQLAFGVFGIIAGCHLTGAQQFKSSAPVDAILASEKVDATFVLMDVTSGELTVSNAARAQRRYVPASTFKIPNTLISLDAGVVRDIDEVIPYGGKPQRFKAWEHDMPLREAMPISAVPIYQELARRVGLARMAAAVTTLNYGNNQIGDVVDKFWLVGPLEISAIEQARFLARLVQYQLPVSPRAVNAVEEITQQEKSDDAEVHYKTGWQGPEGAQTAWLIGWVRRGDGVSTFAFNFKMFTLSDGPKRWQITRKCLVALGKLK